MEVQRSSFENLVTILAIAAIASMVGLTVKMIEQNSIPFVIPVEPIKGYVRPSTAQDAVESKAEKAKRLTAMAHKKPVIKKQNAGLIKMRFDQAVALLHGKQYEYAIKALDDILKIQNDMPEVYVNMGFAYLGLKDFTSATSAFEKAIDVRPDQVNAYYGLAIAYEGNKDLEGALGAMRSYIHLSDPDDKFLAKARSAIWEWEAELGRVKGVTVAPAGAKSPLTKSGAHTRQDKQDK